MSSVQFNYGQTAYIPTINNRTAGVALGSGDDFLTPKAIGNLGSGFVRTVTPTSTNSRYILNDPYFYTHNADPAQILVNTNRFTGGVNTVTSNGAYIGDPTNYYSHNANSAEFLLLTNDFTTGVTTQTSQNPTSLIKMPYLQYPYAQGVPNIGTNPNAMKIMSASTQFQSELQTIGAPAIPGYPVVNFGKHPSALDFMGNTQSFVNSMMPYHPTYGQPTVYPGATGGAYGYPFPQIMPNYPTGPYGATNYPRFGQQIPYPQNPFLACSVPVSGPTPAYPWLNQGYFQRPWQQGGGYNQPAKWTSDEAYQAIRQNTFELPDVIPTNVSGGLPSFIDRFNAETEGKRIDWRQKWVNATTVDETILNSTGITNTGGTYNKGLVTNPFSKTGFLTDTNPYETFRSGLVVTNGNDNGKMKGTPVRDLLLGTVGRNNIIDGRGGQDDIYGSTKNDMVSVYAGDNVFLGSGDDLLFFDFSKSASSTTRPTEIVAGDGQDVMVLTVDANPTLDSGSPKFQKLSNGQTSVSYNGIQVITEGVERFIVADKLGNVGSVYETTTT